MVGELFFERYRICRDPDGKPAEAGRAGAATTYKAIDEQSSQPVLLQLVPLAAIDQARRGELEARAQTVVAVDHINVARILAAGVEHDYLAFVTEYLEGETAEAWIVAHGTMTPDAVLRIGIQVVRATAAAAFHGLTHRAIQPSNIIILHGESPSGGWPFIKLSNFGVAALELHGESNEARELAPALVPQFASPEQVRKQQIDFRSEMYSLGATMCFLLTGAVPLPTADEASVTRRGRRRLPELRSMPKPVRSLLGVMLAENPEDRPLDPVALERHMVAILGKIEGRQAWARKLGIPLAASVQRKIVRSPSPFAQVVRGGLVFAALLIVLAAIGAILYPQYFHRIRPLEEIGVPIGVPVAGETSTSPPVTATSSPARIVAASQPTAAPSISPVHSAPIPQASPVTPAASLAQNARPGNAPAPAETKVTPPPSSALANFGPWPPRSPASPATPQSQPNAVQAPPASSNSVAQNPPPDDSTSTVNTSRSISPSRTMTADAKAKQSGSEDRESEPPSRTMTADANAKASTSADPESISPSKTLTADAKPNASASADREPEPPSAAADDEDASSSVSQSKPSRATQPKVTTRSKAKTVARNYSQTRAPNTGRWSHAYFIGVTPSGRMLFRLPSGKIVAMRPGQRRAPVAVRPRYFRPPPDPQIYYGPPPYGYPPPDD